jgi:Helicase conserved C-terminal domain
VTRFVVDECHQVMTCNKYRKKFDAVKELAQYPVQKIFITATLAVFLEDYFLQQIYLPRSTPVIREPTNRNNLMYHMLRIEQRVRKAEDVIIDLTKLVEREVWTEASRGIIFCHSRAEVDNIGTFFGNTKSHSDMDPLDRSDLQEKWNEGHQGHKWMIATTGFIHGIDHPNVDTIIFLEMPYGLNNFVQGAGRAGRSGRPAHIFLLDYCLTICTHPTDIDAGAIQAGARFVANGTDCRRTILSDVMDGLPVRCADLYGAISCDICDPKNSMVLASRKLLQPVRIDTPDYDQGGWDDTTLATMDLSFIDSAQSSSPSMSLQLDHAIYIKLQKDKRAKVAELTALTKAVGGILDGCQTGYCVICWVWKGVRKIKSNDHRYFIDCKSTDDRFVHHAIGWIKMKRQFRFEKFKYCWRCGLPQGDFAPATHPTFKVGDILKCPFDDLVALIIWYIINTEDVWKRACSFFTGLKSTMSLESITKWLDAEEHPSQFYNGLELVIWYWVTYKESLLKV